MNNFTKYLDEQLKDEKFKKEWNGLELKYQFINKLIALREEKFILYLKELYKHACSCRYFYIFYISISFFYR